MGTVIEETTGSIVAAIDQCIRAKKAQLLRIRDRVADANDLEFVRLDAQVDCIRDEIHHLVSLKQRIRR